MQQYFHIAAFVLYLSLMELGKLSNIFIQSIGYVLRNNRVQSLFIIIGISLSVAIISSGIFIIEGLQNYAIQTINSEGAFTTIIVSPNDGYELDGHYFDRDSIYQLDYNLSKLIISSVKEVNSTQLFFKRNEIYRIDSNKIVGVEIVSYSAPEIIKLEDSLILSGQNLPQSNSLGKKHILVNASFVDRANELGFCLNVDSVLSIVDQVFLICGIFENNDYNHPTIVARYDSSTSYLSLGADSRMYIKSDYNNLISIKDSVENILIEKYGGDMFYVKTHQTQLDEVLRYLDIAKFIVFFLYLLIVLISCIYISNIMVLASLLRGEEISIRRAVGASKSDILVQVSMELFLQILISIIIGFTLGISIANLFSWIFYTILDVPRIDPLYNFLSILKILLGTIFISSIFSIIPIKRIVNIDIVKIISN